MLQRAASNAYSWWWASHIRTKQSKWLEQNLLDMEEKVQVVLKLIEEDGDSFAKRAEMYYKKRPELINFVEESYRAYRSLAERYDHISTELQNANTTIASVFPEQVQFSIDDEDDVDGPPRTKTPRKHPEGAAPNSPKVPKPPSKHLKSLLMTANKDIQSNSKRQQKGKAGSLKSLVPKSGLNKDEAVGQIDKLQKEILGLQTEKEYLTSAYENGLTRYWEIDQQIEEKQEKIYTLQDEFNVSSLIEDDEARKLMASAALKTCQDTLVHLEESQERSVAEAKVEHQRIKDARDKLVSLRDELVPNQEDQTGVPDIKAGTTDFGKKLELENQHIESLREKIKEQIDVNFNKPLTVTDMTEKIDELVQKVVSFETAVSSQNALINRLRAETDELLSHIRSLEEEKAMLLNDTGVLSSKFKEMESELNQVNELNQNVEAQNTNLQTHFMEAHCNLDHLAENIHKFGELSATESLADNAGVLGEIESAAMARIDSPVENSGVLADQLEKAESTSSLIVDQTQDDAPVQDTDSQLESKNEAKQNADNFIESVQVQRDETDVNQLLVSVEVKGDGADTLGEEPEVKVLSEILQTTEPSLTDDNSKQDSLIEVGDQVTAAVAAQEKKLVEEGEPDWRALYMEGLGDREKIILREYTITLRNYKELKQKVSNLEKMNKGGVADASAQLNKLRILLAKRDEEIQSLRQKLSLLSCDRVTSTDAPPDDDDDDDDMKLALADLRPTSVIEEKFRMQIDELLEENLNFWLRFSSSFTQVQKFQSEVEDLQAEVQKLEDKLIKKLDGSTKHRLPKSDAKPIYKHLTEIRTEINVWLEQSGLLNEELQRRFSSLCSIQDEISAALMEACEEIEDAEFTSYRAAKFQGEILNMKQENNKVEEETQAAREHAKRILQEIDKTLVKLDEDFKLSDPNVTHRSSSQAELPRTGSKSRVPLRSFIFGVKQKRQRHSFFSSVRPALALHWKLHESKSASTDKNK